MSKHNAPEIEIFRAGTHTAMDGSQFTVTPADLAAIADRYDPTKGEAPLVVGHPQTNAPAYGWVQKLRAEGDLLFATPHQVDDGFAAMVKAGRFKKRSASFFRPGSAGNPTPDAVYLRHVGFLGATPPAVTGLRDASFAADADAATVEFGAPESWWTFGTIARLFRRLRDDLIARDGLEKADELLAGYEIESIAEAARPPAAPSASFAIPQEFRTVSDNQTADFAARESALASREAQIATREAELRSAESAARRAECVEFCAGLTAQGRLLPKFAPQIVELLVSVSEQPQTLNFAAADGSQASAPAADALRVFLSSLPAQVDMNEISGGGDPATSVDFAAPDGSLINRDRLALDAKAQQYLHQHPNSSYLDAVRAVGG